MCRDSWPWVLEHDAILAQYSLHSHRSSILHLVKGSLAHESPTARRAHADGWTDPYLQWLTDIPGCGDTAFPSFIRISKTQWLVINYTSPTDACADWSWLEGQVSPDGTALYFVIVTFTPA